MSPFSLVLGESYLVRDWYGQMGFEGVFRGIIKDSTYQDGELLCFERVPTEEGLYRFYGATPTAHFHKDYKTGGAIIDWNLQITHYGQEMGNLLHINRRAGLPKWELK